MTNPALHCAERLRTLSRMQTKTQATRPVGPVNVRPVNRRVEVAARNPQKRATRPYRGLSAAGTGRGIPPAKIGAKVGRGHGRASGRYTVQPSRKRGAALDLLWLIYGPSGWPVLFAHGLRHFSHKSDAETVAYWLNRG